MHEHELENTVRDLWIRIVEEKARVRAEELGDTIEKLVERGLARVEDGVVVLTGEGEQLGRKLVRLHRLTERLLFDILGAEEEVYEKVACQVEHTIPEELEEAICTLLGHPTRCPHGKPIPPGRCCIEGRTTVQSLVQPLTAIPEGSYARISYMDVDEAEYTRLVGLGLAPGKKIRVHRTRPTVIVTVGDTEVALDRDTASHIYAVILAAAQPRKEGWRHRWRHRKGQA